MLGFPTLNSHFSTRCINYILLIEFPILPKSIQFSLFYLLIYLFIYLFILFFWLLVWNLVSQMLNAHSTIYYISASAFKLKTHLLPLYHLIISYQFPLLCACCKETNISNKGILRLFSTCWAKCLPLKDILNYRNLIPLVKQ